MGVILLVLTAIPILHAIALLITDRLRPGQNVLWVVNVSGSAILWLAAVVSGLLIPIDFHLPEWMFVTEYEVSPVLLLDNISWPFLFTVASLYLAVTLTSAARPPAPPTIVWASNALLMGAAVFAICSANPTAVLMSWAAIDIIEVATLINRTDTPQQRNAAIEVYATRLASLGMVLAGMLFSIESGQSLLPSPSAPQINLLYGLAAGLRTGVLPIHAPFVQEPRFRRGLGTLIRLIPAAAGLVLIVRLAGGVYPLDWEEFLVLAAVLSGIFGGAGWLISRNELDGRPFLILAYAALAVASSLRGAILASLAWSLALIFVGAGMFLRSRRGLGYRILAGLSLFLGIGLPLTPSWGGGGLLSGESWYLYPLVVITLALIMAGSLRHLSVTSDPDRELETWRRVAHVGGQVIFPVALFPLLLLGDLWGTQSFNWWLGIVSVLLGCAMWWLTLRFPIPEALEQGWFFRFVSFSWFYQVLWWLYQRLEGLFVYATRILEGQSGVLWTFLIMLVLISLLVQFGGV